MSRTRFSAVVGIFRPMIAKFPEAVVELDNRERQITGYFQTGKTKPTEAVRSNRGRLKSQAYSCRNTWAIK